MKTSDSINELAAALAKARQAIKNPVKNKTVEVKPREGRAYTYSYAELPSVLDAITGPLAAEGLTIVETIAKQENHLILHTRLVHSSGQWIEGAYPIFCDMTKPQVVGGALTYGRRYAISALINIASEDDNDASDSHGEDYNIRSKGNGHRDADLQDVTGNPGAKHYKTNGTTAKAIEARSNNEFYTQCQTEIRQAQSPEALKEWAMLRKAEIGKKLSPAAVETLQEVYENHKADLLARIPA